MIDYRPGSMEIKYWWRRLRVIELSSSSSSLSSLLSSSL